MRSLIIIEVEHGEDTDALTDFIESAPAQVAVTGMTFLDSTVRVDVPDCFTL